MEEFWRQCMSMMMGSGGVIMMLLMILFWIAVLVVLVLAIRWLWQNTGGFGIGEKREEALRILDRRFAGGEISREEYEDRRRVLGQGTR